MPVKAKRWSLPARVLVPTKWIGHRSCDWSKGLSRRVSSSYLSGSVVAHQHTLFSAVYTTRYLQIKMNLKIKVYYSRKYQQDNKPKKNKDWRRSRKFTSAPNIVAPLIPTTENPGDWTPVLCCCKCLVAEVLFKRKHRDQWIMSLSVLIKNFQNKLDRQYCRIPQGDRLKSRDKLVINSDISHSMWPPLIL